MSNDLELKLVLRATDQGLSGVVRDVKDETVALDKSFDQAAKSSGHFADKLSQSDQAAGRSYDKMGRLREANGRFVAGAKNATEQTGALNRKLKENAGQAKKSAKESASFSKTLKDGAAKAGVWVAAVTGAVAIATSFATSLRTDAIRESQILAQTLNTNVQAITEWEYAAGQMNIANGKMGDIFKDASDKIGDFVTTGGGEAADLFENLNLKVNDLINLSPDQQLLAIGDALDDVDNRGQQVFFLESLADDASRLLPLLENDAAELKRLQLEARVLGVSLNDVDAAKVTQAAQSFDRVRGLATGTANDLTIELAPILGGIADLWVDSTVEAGGFRDTVRDVIDGTVTGIGFVLDIGQQLRLLLKYSENGWLMIGQAGTGAMASVADSTAKVINTVMYPFQKALAWIIDKYAYLIEIGSKIGGPFADEFEAAAEGLRGFSTEIDQFALSGEGIIALNERMSQALINSSNELEALINAGASSDELVEGVKKWRESSEAAAKVQSTLRQQTKRTNTVIRHQTDTYGDLVKQLEDELDLLKLGNRDREIEIALRKLDADATDTQKEKIRQLTGALYDHKEELKHNEDAAKVWSTITDNAIQSVDDSFRELFRSGLDGWDNFWDQMKSTAKDMLAELAYTLAKEKLWVNVGMNVSGQQAAGGSGPSSAQLGNNPFSSVFNNTLSYPISNAINQGASTAFGNSLYAVNNPALVNNVAAIKSGAVSVSSPASQLAGGAAAGLGAYGFAQQHGVVGGVAGGVGTAALAGGISSAVAGGGFMAGASGALAGLGPVGWAAIGIGALLGGLKGKPSDKTQWAGFTGADNLGFSGGFDGKKFSQENRSAAEQMAGVLNTFNQALDHYSGSDFSTAMQVQVGSRDGLVVSASDLGSAAALGQTPNGSATLEDSIDIYSGSDAGLAMDAAIEYMAEQQGVLLDVYRENAREGELLGDVYMRLNQQYDVVRSALEGLGIPLSAVGDDALRASDELVAAAGGLNAFTSLTSTYYSAFYTAEEQFDDFTNSLSTQFAGLGLSIPGTRDEFRTLVESLDLTTESAQQQFGALMQLVPALDQYYGALEGQDAVIAKQQALIVEQANKAASAYFSAFGTELQQFDALAQQAQSIADTYSVDLPASREDFRELINSVDWSTDAGQQLAADLTDAIPVLDAYYSALEDQEVTLTDSLSAQSDTVAEYYQQLFDLEADIYAIRIDTLQAEHSIARDLLNTVTSLSLSDSLSPLSATEQLELARSEYARLQVLSEAGDTDALSELGGAAEAYLSELASYAPNSALYSSEFDDVTGYLQTLGTELGGLSSIDDEIATLNQQMLSEQRELAEMARSELSYLASTSGGISTLAGLLDALPESLGSLLSNSNTDSSTTPDRAGVAYGTVGNGADLRAEIDAYFASTSMGDALELAGGILTRNANGSATWAGGGESFTATASSSISDITSQSDTIKELWQAGYGYEAVNSFDVGTAYVSHDQRADIHRGEIIVDPRSSDVLRRYGIGVRAESSANNEAVVSELQALRLQLATVTAELSNLRAERRVDARDQIRATEAAGRQLRREVATV